MTKFDKDDLRRIAMLHGHWPPTPQAVIDAHHLFGAERADQLIRRAHSESVSSLRSVEDHLRELIGKEQIAREKERPADRGALKPEAFAVSLRGWPRRGL